MKINGIFFLVVFLLGPLVVYAQIEERKYDITAAGINIGEMVATRETKGEVTNYTLHSKVSFWFFIRVNVDYQVHSTYQGDKLVSSVVTTKSNRGDFKSTVQWNTDHYDVHVNGYKYTNDTPIKDPIMDSSAKFYFEYPQHITTILADNYGVMVPAENIRENVYTVTVQGNKNTFYFDKGKVTRAVQHHPIKNFEVTLQTP